MPNKATDTKAADEEGQQLIHELQLIRDRLSDHAQRHPRAVDYKSARKEVERAVQIAIKAGSKPHSDVAANTWLGYIIDEYALIIRADAAKLADHLYR